MDSFLSAAWTDCLGSLTLSGLADGLAWLIHPLAQAASQVTREIEEGVSMAQWWTLIVGVGVLVLPFILGGMLARAIKMPNYATRLGFILLAIIASAVILVNKRPGLGVDLRGGTILVYEIDPDKNVAADDQPGQRITSADLIEPLSRRINPSGTQEIVIRPYGETQIEIIIPEVDQREVDRIKSVIEEAGILRFAILANRADHQRIIDNAMEQAESPDQQVRTRGVVSDGDTTSTWGLWARVDREENEVGGVRPLRVNVGDAIVRNPRTGEILDLPIDVRGEDGEVKIARWLEQQGMNDIEVLMIVDPLLDIKGEDLAFAASTFDEHGQPAVAFNLTDAGSGRFFALTTNNAPVGNRQRQLGIILDNDLLSAPNILQPIRTEGRITGNFTREEVDRLVAILKAGQLPAALTPQPIAENQIDATLGSDTIRKGVFATGLSLLTVLVFMLFYYRFSGVVACIALFMNLAMILASMVLINQPLTLPGLAGLVLTVGMSVDANVLIFERFREELAKGASERLVIRNGFARATVTIIDSNLTTLITAIVLYAIGTDQVRGFAVTLILGILYSMFTAIYMSRTLYDIAERKGFVSLSMSDLINQLRRSIATNGQFDFMSVSKAWTVFSVLMMTGGLIAVIARGNGILDIDFAGGSSVQFRLDQSTPPDEVRRIVESSLNTGTGEPIQSTVTSVNMENSEPNTIYKVDSSLEKVDDLKAAIARGFASESNAGLVTYQVEVQPVGDAASVSPTPQTPANSNGVMLTAARAQDDAAADTPAEPESAETAPEDAQPADPAPADTETPAEDSSEVEATETTEGTDTGQPSATTRRMIEVGIEGGEGGASINAPTLVEALQVAAEKVEVPLDPRRIELTPMGEGVEAWNPESSLAFSQWTVQLPLNEAQTTQVIQAFTEFLNNDPVWISSSSVGGQVAGDMVGRAFGALFGSLICVIAYIWFRFQRVYYGIAAVAALVHDVLVTLGAIAISYWVADALGFLLIDPFKISLTVVAAILTLIGYSLNDTIVVFDRIREIKGKAPRLTGDMINDSVNQTLSRTLLTAVTTFIVVLLLYVFGGEGIHAFAFSLVIGVVAGTYSSVFVAAPMLLWLLDRDHRAKSA